MKKNFNKYIYFLLLLVAWPYLASGGSLAFYLEPIDKLCFWHQITTANPTFSIDYWVISGDGLDISFSFITPNGNIIVHETTYFSENFKPNTKRRKGSTKSLTPENKNNNNKNADITNYKIVSSPAGNVTILNLFPGEYKFCFDNRIVTHSKKAIRFWMNNKDIPTIKDKQKREKITTDDTEGVMDQISSIMMHLDRVEKMQSYVKGRLHRHLWTQDSTNARAQWTALFFITGCIACVVGQIALIRTWFKENKHTYRI